MMKDEFWEEERGKIGSYSDLALFRKRYVARHTNIPKAVVAPRTSTKTGLMSGCCNTPRRTAANSAAENEAITTSQSLRGFDADSRLNSPSAKAVTYHASAREMNMSDMRGRKVIFNSPCEAKPMRVVSKRARMSPRMSAGLFMINFFTTETPNHGDLDTLCLRVSVVCS